MSDDQAAKAAAKTAGRKAAGNGQDAGGGDGAGNGQSAQQGEGTQQNLPPYVLQSQYIKDLSFENPRAPEIFVTPRNATPNVNIAMDVTTRHLQERMVEVSLHIEVRASFEEQDLFVLELVYAGIVLVGNIPKQSVQPLLLVEVPRIMFPFVRQLVAEITRDGGFSMLMMPPFDFVALYERKMAGQAGGDGGQEGAAAQATDGADEGKK